MRSPLRPGLFGSGLAASLLLAGCSTGTIDRGLFAHTEIETFARVRAAVPVGTPTPTAQTTLKAMGWTCYVAPHFWVIPNDTGKRIDGPVLSCDAYPSAGGYPLSKQYSLNFLIEAGAVGPLQVQITDPGA